MLFQFWKGYSKKLFQVLIRTIFIVHFKYQVIRTLVFLLKYLILGELSSPISLRLTFKTAIQKYFDILNIIRVKVFE